MNATASVADNINTTEILNVFNTISGGECLGNYLAIGFCMLLIASEGCSFMSGDTPNGLIQGVIAMIKKQRR